MVRTAKKKKKKKNNSQTYESRSINVENIVE